MRSILIKSKNEIKITCALMVVNQNEIHYRDCFQMIVPGFLGIYKIIQ